MAFSSLSTRWRADDTAGRALAASERVSGLLSLSIVGATLAAAWLATLLAGGSKTVLPHLFYVPVVLAAARFRPRGAVTCALAAGIAAGPLMPQDVAAGQAQPLVNWLARTAAFVFMGLLVGWLTRQSRNSIVSHATQARTATQLRKALANGQFHVVYQPIVDLASGTIIGYEALLRWVHPERGAISPARFIPMAEQSGAIIELGRYVVNEALHQLRDWHEEGRAGLFMAVNVSPAQLGHPDLVDEVLLAVTSSGVPAESVHIEITETAIIRDVPSALAQVTSLRALGVRLALDDFGVGQSSLSLLHEFPIDVVKIDRAFVSRMTTQPKSAGMVSAITRMADAIGATTIGEGIETADQLTALIELGCVMGQGFHLGRPARPADVAKPPRMVPRLA